MTRKRSLVGTSLALAAVLLAGLPASGLVPTVSAQAGGQLGTDLDALLHDPSLRGGNVGLVVREADSGNLLYNSQSDRRGQPASNMKLVTSATAMDVLGPDHRFTTSVLTTGRTRGPILAGDLYLRGTGDPTMLATDYDALAAKVAAGGIRIVQGKLIADDTWFDANRLGLGWAWDDEPYYYNAQISALTASPNTDYDAGTVIVSVAPGAAGKPAVVTTDPPTSYVKIENTAVTGQPGSASTVSVERQHGTNVVKVSGSLPAGAAADREWTTVWEPTGLAASLFRDALGRHGVRVLGQTQAGVATPAGARSLAEHQSMPLSQLLVPFLKLSNNMHAEILVKTVGRTVSGTGSWDAGLAAVGQRLKALGIDPATLYLADGSGLSRMDQISPDQLIALLRAVRAKPWFRTWFDALPIAGVSDRMVGGTLRSRMAGTAAAGNVHAKTGTLTGVSALSGYVTSADGRQLVFSMMTNDVLGSAKRIEDGVAVRLAQYRADETARQATLAPAPAVAPQPGARDLECSWVKAC
jgi:D-alanyl-D-alanine carboxypeptidase/D-alanyl-D-alanine-endopeptidase (penicillin-binding protein 4)